MAIVWKEIGGELKLIEHDSGATGASKTYEIKKKCIIVVSSNKSISVTRRSGSGTLTELGSKTNWTSSTNTASVYEVVYLAEPEESMTIAYSSQGTPIIAVITV